MRDDQDDVDDRGDTGQPGEDCLHLHDDVVTGNCAENDERCDDNGGNDLDGVAVFARPAEADEHGGGR